jgi:hypothetical protein
VLAALTQKVNTTIEADREGGGLDWVKPPHYRSVWNTFHSSFHLKYHLDYADPINGFIPETINISIVQMDDEFDVGDEQLNISPLCSSVDERGIFLSLIQINQLNLTQIGIRNTKLYGEVKTYSGLKLRITSPKCYQYIYRIPDGYIFELPKIFTSSRLVSTSGAEKIGIPQRQGIVHREIFYQHALVSYHGSLYGLTDELFHLSGIPSVMAKFPRCETFQAQYPSQQQLQQHSSRRVTHLQNINSLLRPLIYSTPPLHREEPDSGTHSFFVHPSLTDDHIDASISHPPVTLFLNSSLQCFYCKEFHQMKTPLMIYCPLCRKRCVQSPHVYCSRHCLLAHRQDHSSYHETTQSEHLIIEPNDLPDPHQHQQHVQFSNTPQPTNAKKSQQKQEIKVVKFQRNVFLNRSFGSFDSLDPVLPLTDDQDSVKSKIESEFEDEVARLRLDRPEVWIGSLLCFYLMCWFILRSGEGDRGLPDHIHDEM